MNLRWLSITYRLAGACLYVIFFGVMPIVAHAQGGIDEVLNRAENKHAVRNSLGVDSSVYESISSALQEGQKKAEKIDRANSEFRSVGSDSNTVAREAASPAADRGNADQKIWRCKVYCKSVNGPVTWKEISAKTRREAAKWMDQNADAICHSAGNNYASSVSFSENQCSER